MSSFPSASLAVILMIGVSPSEILIRFMYTCQYFVGFDPGRNVQLNVHGTTELKNPMYRNISVSGQKGETFHRPVAIYKVCETTGLKGRMCETTNFIVRCLSSLFTDLNIQQS